jgi:transposase
MFHNPYYFSSGLLPFLIFSLVPSPLIRELRTYSREYRNLVNQRTKVLTQMDRLPVMCGIRLSSCISNIDSRSFIQVTEALIREESDPERLVHLVYGNCKNKECSKLKACLTDNMKAHHRLKLTTCKQQLDLIEQQIKLYLNEMQKLCDEHFKEDIDNLTTILGVSFISTMIIIAETGGDMSAFETSGNNISRYLAYFHLIIKYIDVVFLFICM